MSANDRHSSLHDSQALSDLAADPQPEFALFSAPPPPVAPSRSSGSSRSVEARLPSGQNHFRPGWLQTDIASLSQNHSIASGVFGSTLRGLRCREKAVEQDIQELLDAQASALAAGRGTGLDSIDDNGQPNDTLSNASLPRPSSASGTRDFSPIGNFFATPPSVFRSALVSTQQPTGSSPLDLGAARSGIQQSIKALIQLKWEESAHLEAASTQRKSILSRFTRLQSKRVQILSEIEALQVEDDVRGESFGMQLLRLSSQRDSLDREILLLEEKLAEMRTRRRRLCENIDDVESRRDAALSGYRGALKDLDSQLGTLLRHPLVQQLDPDLLIAKNSLDAGRGATWGSQFMRLIPERRTVQMAVDWLQLDIGLLDQCKAQIDDEMQALQEGDFMWRHVVSLVTNYESELREVTRVRPASLLPMSVTGAEAPVPTRQVLRHQVARMKQVTTDLEHYLSKAEKNCWNLLICAVGAELQAFKEARTLLDNMLNLDSDPVEPYENPSQKSQSLAETNEGDTDARYQRGDTSDNEVPPDLIVSSPGGEMSSVPVEGYTELAHAPDVDEARRPCKD